MTTHATAPAAHLAGFAREDQLVNGIRTAVLTIGSGPDLVFLHGTGTFTGFEVARGWARSNRVILPYHPGFGASADDPAISSIDDHVMHYMTLFDQLGLRRFALAGHSLGGWIAAEYAVRQPERVEKLVLVSPAGLVDADAPAPDLFQIAPQDMPGFLACNPAKILPLFPSGPDPDFEAGLGREIGALARLVQAEPQGNPKLSRWLHRLTMPTLVLWGAEDRLRPTAQARAWNRLLPDGTVVLVPETGHLVFEETPESGRIVTDFLTATPHQKETSAMTLMPPGVTPAAAAYDGYVWNILGQTYALKQITPDSMAWHATFPPGTFVPPHIHPNQDEYIYVLSGTYEVWIDGTDMKAVKGDLVRLPRGLAHGIFNRSDAEATSLFWVAPTGPLLELFKQIDRVPDPAEVVRIAALHEVEFLPPPK